MPTLAILGYMLECGAGVCVWSSPQTGPASLIWSARSNEFYIPDVALLGGSIMAGNLELPRAFYNPRTFSPQSAQAT